MRLRRGDVEWQRLTPPLSGRHPGRRSPCEPPARATLVVLPLAGGSGRCEARDAALTERRRRCVRAAPNLPYPGAVVRLRPSVCAAGRSYPRAPRNRSREVQRYDGEAHDAKTVAPIQRQAGIGRLLGWACCMRRKQSPKSGIFRWYTGVRMLARDAADTSSERPQPNPAAAAAAAAAAGKPVFPPKRHMPRCQCGGARHAMIVHTRRDPRAATECTPLEPTSDRSTPRH